MSDSDRKAKFDEMKSTVISGGNLSSTDLKDTLSTLANLALASTSMSSDTAESIVDTLAESLNTTTIQASLVGMTAAEKKDALKGVAAQAEAALLAVTKNVLGGLTAGGSASEFTSSSGIKLKVAKKNTATLATTAESVVSTSGKAATFTMPATLPAALTGLSNVGLQISASTKTFDDPDAVYEPKSDSFSLTFTDDSGNVITGLTFTG